jgi:hypothetical protein
MARRLAHAVVIALRLPWPWGHLLEPVEKIEALCGCRRRERKRQQCQKHEKGEAGGAAGSPAEIWDHR